MQAHQQVRSATTSGALSPADRTYLEKLIPSIGHSWNAGDRDAYVDRYAEDAIYMVPNQTLLDNKKAIREFVYAFPEVKVKFTTEEIGGTAAQAYIRGTYVLTGPDGDLMDKGKFLDIMMKDETGQWLGTHDIWNSDLPVPGADG